MFSIKGFHSKCDQIRSFLQIWSHLLKKSLMENFIFCVVMLTSFLNSTSKVSSLQQIIVIRKSVTKTYHFRQKYDNHPVFPYNYYKGIKQEVLIWDFS